MPQHRREMPDGGAPLAEVLGRYGAPPSGIVSLRVEPGADHLPYLDLLHTSERTEYPDAVVEVERRPVVYAVDGRHRRVGRVEVEHLRHILAQRAVADHLAVVEPGKLLIYALDDASRQRPLATRDEAPEAALAIPRLALGLANGPKKTRFHDRLLHLFSRTTASVASSARLPPEDALSWVGRAVFVRFLADRGIIPKNAVRQVCGAAKLEAAFARPSTALRTSRWLDAKFNGDLLPLSRGRDSLSWDKIGAGNQAKLCDELSKVMVRAEFGGQLSFAWDALDFSHIPVGLLSQVYERFAHDVTPDAAAQHSVHYTPRAIAEYMVDEALLGLNNVDAAKVLDPAAGAGVFLVAALRALVRERWRQTGRRPARAAIRDILYNQLTGFDVSESALRLAALSLYLTALELDPAPWPIDELRFDNLRGRVLHAVVGPNDDLRRPYVVGSLGSHVSEEHNARYDVVVGNPPWTSWEAPKDATGSKKRFEAERRISADEVEKVVREIAIERIGEDGKRFEMTDFLPDVPFAWRAMRWCRPGGRIALALHARLLFRQSEHGTEARELLFRAVRTTGVLNGSALRMTAAWPGITATFCLWFAQNEKPAPSDTFNFVSPFREKRLNSRGVIRIDATAAVPVAIAEVLSSPTLLKTLWRGTELDVPIVERMAGFQSLVAYWHTLGLKHGQGFQIGGTARKKQPAQEMIDLKLRELVRERGAPPLGAVIDVDALPRFRREELLYRREIGIYFGPVVLVPEAPPARGRRGSVHLAIRNVAYNRSFFGFSCHGHPSSEALARYIQVLLASSLMPYLALMTSSKFGVERDVYHQEDVEAFPVRPFETLGARERKAVDGQAARLHGGAPPDEALDDVVGTLYGLGPRERRTMVDALTVGAPFAESRERAEATPSESALTVFRSALADSLRPFFERRGHVLDVVRHASRPGDPWRFFSLAKRSADFVPSPPSAQLLATIVEQADRYGSSLVVVPEAKNSTLTIGILAQHRFFTPTRAALLARQLRSEHEDFLCRGALR